MLIVGVFAAATVPGIAVADETLTDGGTYWQGQTLTYSDGLSADESVRVMRSAGGLAFTDQADANGVVALRTTDLEGEYRLEDANGNELATFSVRVASLRTDPSAATVDLGGSTTQVAIDLASERGGATIAIQSSELSQAEIQTIFGTTQITLDGSGEASLTGEFGDVDVGTYDFQFVVQDGTASASMDVEVTRTTATATAAPANAATVSDAQQEANQLTAQDPGGEEATTPQRGFLTNGESGPLSNVLNLTVLGFLLSALGIVYQLVEGR